MNESLTYSTGNIASVSDDVASLNARYQGGIDDINSTVSSKLAGCSGEIYNEFLAMYQNTVGKALQEGQQIITTWSSTLGTEVVDSLNTAEKTVVSNFGG